MNKRIIAILLCMVWIFACRKPNEFNEESYDERLSGGSNTVFDESSSAFSQMFPTLTGRNAKAHELGDISFERTFVTAPAPVNPGLGPIYNNVSCVSCHVSDGRGKAPDVGEGLLSLLLRVSIPGKGTHGEPLAVPGCGGQLQTHSVYGKQPEADVVTTYINSTEYFDDGESVELRKPVYQLSNSYIALPSNIQVSPRLAPPVFGLGLLEAISESDIKLKEDINDADGDGISGKTNLVWNAVTLKKELGRFGWKAGQPNLKQQSAGAYNEDMGVTNPIFKTESSYNQPQYIGVDDSKTEISDSVLTTVAFYMQSLAVPARRNVDDSGVKLGKKIFKSIDCEKCHTSTMRTQTNVAFKELSNQLIHPYSDMLLHNMGDALADNREEFEADGYEWRTQTLWGIGLTKKINGHTNFLHDGRARNYVEAIFWHGGEAQKSNEKFKALSKSDRNALVAFLNSL
jgi:CxxC motif-containing protein (DUF1111 family)